MKIELGLRVALAVMLSAFTWALVTSPFDPCTAALYVATLYTCAVAGILTFQGRCRR